jgi:hypothetical protein
MILIPQNGMLQGMLALAAPRMSLGSSAFAAFEVLTLFGTWNNGAAFLHTLVTGIGSPLLPLIHASHPFSEVSDTSPCHYHLLITITLIPALVLALVGLMRGPPQAAAKGAKNN